MTQALTPDERRTAIRSALRIPPAPKAENSDRIDAITALMAEIQASGDTVALMQLARQFSFAAEQTL
jgi:hypothetical protein